MFVFRFFSINLKALYKISGEFKKHSGPPKFRATKTFEKLWFNLKKRFFPDFVRSIKNKFDKIQNFLEDLSDNSFVCHLNLARGKTNNRKKNRNPKFRF